MSRAVLLPTPGDPFLLQYWLNNYNRYYADEINHLYIYLNTSIEKEAVDYCLELVKDYPHTSIYYHKEQVEHGDGINFLLDQCQEDLVMLAEDDAYIFKKGLINSLFNKLEDDSYDLIGSKRFSCSDEILNKARELWGLNYEGYGDQGCNFWPAFLFTHKKYLLKTDRRFGARSWKQGEVIESLNNHVVNGEIAVGDTFVNTSLQLRAMGLRILTVNQYHGSPYDLDDYSKKRNLWDGEAGWVHVGSLSSGINGVLVDKQLRPLGNRKRQLTEFPNYCNTEGEKKEWERRVQWWLMFYEGSRVDKLTELRKEYYEAIEKLILEYKLNMNDIYQRIRIYRKLGL